MCLAGDPGMASGMTEQDDRYFGRISSMPMLEPADSQECYEYAKRAFAMSEEFDVPVMVRLSIQTAHQKSIVRFDGDVAPDEDDPRKVSRPAPERRPPDRKTEKYCLLPKFSRPLHRSLLERVERLYAFAEASAASGDLAQVVPGAGATEEHPGGAVPLRGGGTARIGVVSAGAAYCSAREALPGAAFLKLGMIHPLPVEAIRAFAATVDRLFVVEELEPYLEEQILAAGIACEGKAVVPAVGRADGRAGGPGLPRRRPRPPALGGGEGRGGRHRHPAAARALHRLPAPRHGHGDEEAQPRRARRHRLLRPHHPAAGEPHALRRRDGRQHPDGAGLLARRRQRDGLARRHRRLHLPALGPRPACSTPCTSAPT